MPHRSASPTRNRMELSISLGLAAVLVFFIGSGVLAYMNTSLLRSNSDAVAKTHEAILGINEIDTLMKDTETGQRGFLITGDERYLQPYTNALTLLDKQLKGLDHVFKDNPIQYDHLTTIKGFIRGKLDELAETIELRRTQGYGAAREVVITDRGKQAMDEFRKELNEMERIEREKRQTYLMEMENAYRSALISGFISAGLGVLLATIVAKLIQRSTASRKRQEWLQSGEMGVTNVITGDLTAKQVGEAALKFLAEYCGAHAGLFFVREGNDYRRTAEYGIPADAKIIKGFRLGEGLAGQVAKDKHAIVVENIPEDHMQVGSALSQGKPRQLVIAPAQMEGEVSAVLELGFIHPLEPILMELLDRVSENIATAVRSANYRMELQNLLEETQRQAEELQAQGEELRVNNEELEEQSRALKASQTHLEQQQAELEQTNAQLEEQAQQLEVQRDDLSRAKGTLQVKAQELEQASKYKSDFLANMSHELRTPLNSSLILAKLLADNSHGNLSDEQVKFAQTIQASGNDLLALINDILDLSKIEAGYMEVRAEPVRVERLINDLTPLFKPLAAQKNIHFEMERTAGCPDMIETDRQRLEQVLKNLLSNALKFTEEGEVRVKITSAGDRISFAVSDTGIGIEGEQQTLIFDAFRQADGTINRKYGGTGLGLSISRELTRLLGGTITMHSTPGKGSTFVLTVPHIYDASLVEAPHRELPAAMPPAPAADPAKPKKKPAPIFSAPEDDREHLSGSKRTLLIVEDDVNFVRILYDLAHELGFQCLLAATAEEALLTARQYKPHAVVLDVGLPDHSGLSVLDRLKRDARTRHIPVHIVSASDYTQTALAMGAIGYMLKPVKREQLMETMKQFETRFEHRMRQVLIVEDDATQRDSMRKLLGSHEVETVAVGTAAECLEKLKESTFDCMVLDLSLPDASGYSLLETLSREEAYAFPPVIVYTGRDLSVEEEQKLRRYSKSIIIKGAKSPERLLDEVTLFLHQVVADLPPEQQKMLERARNRDDVLENRRILVVEDDVRNIYAITSIFEPFGTEIQIARNGREALEMLEKSTSNTIPDLILMDVMMPEMDGMTATRHIRQKQDWKKLPIIMLTAKAMKDDQERCLEAGANDYMAKPLDVEKLLSLVRVWMPPLMPHREQERTEDIELKLLLEAIFHMYHYDFRGYSMASIRRRMRLAKQHFNCRSYSQLQDMVMHDADKVPALLSFLTVQVSDMFRDPTYFKALREQVIPHLRTYPSLKVWVAGCSAGEEVYSLAILFREEGLESRTMFYATDINQDALKKAEAGVYPLDRIKQFTENHQRSGGKSSLSDYYTAAYGAVTFDKSLRSRVVFSDHSLVSDEVFAEMHLISCRNVLIYFDRDLQDRALNLFNDSLARKGFLGLGSKESLRFSAHSDAFTDFVQAERIYQKRGAA